MPSGYNGSTDTAEFLLHQKREKCLQEGLNTACFNIKTMKSVFLHILSVLGLRESNVHTSRELPKRLCKAPFVKRNVSCPVNLHQEDSSGVLK